MRTIGISFPESEKSSLGLGTTMRLHGNSTDLTSLMEENWLSGMRDHLFITAMQHVPDNCQYRHVQRVQAKSSPDRLRRRRMKRHGIDAQAAQTQIPDSAQEMLKLPYVRIASGSTGQSFPLFIRHGPFVDTPHQGLFSSYGLSGAATIPWF